MIFLAEDKLVRSPVSQLKHYNILYSLDSSQNQYGESHYNNQS